MILKFQILKKLSYDIEKGESDREQCCARSITVWSQIGQYLPFIDVVHIQVNDGNLRVCIEPNTMEHKLGQTLDQILFFITPVFKQ